MKKEIVFVLFFIILLNGIFADCIDINSASASELDKIIYVGESTAQKIIDARTFDNVDDFIKK